MCLHVSVCVSACVGVCECVCVGVCVCMCRCVGKSHVIMCIATAVVCKVFVYNTMPLIFRGVRIWLNW